jgi:hypothetical protein
LDAFNDGLAARSACSAFAAFTFLGFGRLHFFRFLLIDLIRARAIDCCKTLKAAIPKSLVVALPIRWQTAFAFRHQMEQASNEVAIREPGSRRLSAPVPARPEALDDWEYARLSEAAYCNIPRVAQYRRARGLETEGDAAKILFEQGWTEWSDFPSPELQGRFDSVHLRGQVWMHVQTRRVVVSFGGTIFWNIKDWISNFRWFLPLHHDQYTEVVHAFAPEFAKEFQRRVNSGQYSGLNQFQLMSSGHSLGGGLAQQFAYALPDDHGFDVPRVSKVYAMDPSPVTGFYSVKPRLRKLNCQGLKIDRIYERGEILATARAILALLLPPSAKNAAIRGVRYALFKGDPITDHSILRLAMKLQQAAGK